MCRLGHARRDAPRTALLPDKPYSQVYIRMLSTSNLVARMLLLVWRHREEQLLDAAIAPVAGSFLSSSAAVACWVTNGVLALRFGIKLSNHGELLGALRRVQAAEHAQEAWCGTPQQNAVFGVPYRPSE